MARNKPVIRNNKSTNPTGQPYANGRPPALPVHAPLPTKAKFLTRKAIATGYAVPHGKLGQPPQILSGKKNPY